MALGRRPHRHRRQVHEVPEAFAPKREWVAEPTSGPWDVQDEPESDVERVDLGALLVPATAGFELRVEVNSGGQILSATLAGAPGEMQLGVFAAPRSAGIWDEVRAELRASVRSDGGSLDEREGPFGPELVGRVPTGNGLAHARFIGVDGPRWFLRALLVGQVAIDDGKARPLLASLRQVVVNRGTDPLPVREALPLQLPKAVADQIAADQAAQAGQTALTDQGAQADQAAQAGQTALTDQGGRAAQAGAGQVDADGGAARDGEISPDGEIGPGGHARRRDGVTGGDQTARADRAAEVDGTRRPRPAKRDRRV